MLLCLGDSITSEPPDWPSLLEVPHEVRAFAGAKVDDVFEQIRDIDHVDAIVVTVGANETLAIGSPVDADRFAELAAVLSEHAGRVAFLDVNLFRPKYPGLREQRDRVRAAVRSAGVYVIRPVLPWWCWQRDHVHPNRFGQRRVAGSVARWVRAAAR